MNLDEVLDKFAKGTLSRDEVKKALLQQSFIETSCAKLDHNREHRTGGPEVVYCASKTPEQVAGIFEELSEINGRVLGTKADDSHAAAVQERLDCRYDEVSGLLSVDRSPRDPEGKIIVLTAGTSDLPIAEEAAGTAEFLGSAVERHYDCGVAGIHRLFSIMDTLCDASAIIAVAGMEGALPSVVGGVAGPPIVAVPTSVGYGANFQGLSALLTMMNSCAPGIGVVNIDNGFGAGFLAHKINMQAVAVK